MRVDRPAIETLIDEPIGAGEGPVWCDREQSLYFIDIRAPALLRWRAGLAKPDRWLMPSTIGGLGLCKDGRVIVALRSGVHYFDTRGGELELICHPEKDRPDYRLNDAKVSPDGRFFVGSMDTRVEKEPAAALFRVDPDGTTTKVAGDLIVSNGLAWSADARTLFHSDSRAGYVQAFDYDLSNGDVSNCRKIVQLSAEEGKPDGAACDEEGFYWSAGVTAGCLNRIAPDGRIDRKVMLPLAAPTMPCFGGPDLKTLFVTSLTREETAGTLISFRVDVAGAPVSEFGSR